MVVNLIVSYLIVTNIINKKIQKHQSQYENRNPKNMYTKISLVGILDNNDQSYNEECFLIVDQKHRLFQFYNKELSVTCTYDDINTIKISNETGLSTTKQISSICIIIVIIDGQSFYLFLTNDNYYPFLCVCHYYLLPIKVIKKSVMMQYIQETDLFSANNHLLTILININDVNEEKEEVISWDTHCSNYFIETIGTHKHTTQIACNPKIFVDINDIRSIKTTITNQMYQFFIKQHEFSSQIVCIKYQNESTDKNILEYIKNQKDFYVLYSTNEHFCVNKISFENSIINILIGCTCDNNLLIKQQQGTIQLLVENNYKFICKEINFKHKCFDCAAQSLMIINKKHEQDIVEYKNHLWKQIKSVLNHSINQRRILMEKVCTNI